MFSSRKFAICVFNEAEAMKKFSMELSFPTNSNFLIPISLQPDGANL